MSQTMVTEFTESTASISECGTYRYRLTRRWNDRDSILWIMLNPSTADAMQLDPTLRRCLSFSVKWGFGRMVIANLFALRSTDPSALKKHADPVGPDNDNHLSREVNDCSRIVCGWGAHPAAINRTARVIKIVEAATREPFCLGVTREGFPRHPLYVAGETNLIRFPGRATP